MACTHVRHPLGLPAARPERTRALWAAECSEFRCAMGVAEGAGSSAAERIPA
jgi:hypothetical protein